MGSVRCVAVKFEYTFESYIHEKKVKDLLLVIDSGVIERDEHGGGVKILTSGIGIYIDFIEDTISLTYQPHNVDMKYLRTLVKELGKPSKITYVLEKEL